MVNCGKGLCKMEFTGEASGVDAKINVQEAIGFNCIGRYASCPDNYSPPCLGVSASECTSDQFFNLVTCQCECPYNPDGTSCSNPLKVFNPLTCSCELECPSNAPTEWDCYSMGLLWRDCACTSSNNCCRTAIPDYTLWRGYCWDETTEEGCHSEPNGRCVWNPGNCLPGVVMNSWSVSSGSGLQCKFRDEACTNNRDCCSEFCRVDGLCR